jgi:hypothetical protein
VLTCRLPLFLRISLAAFLDAFRRVFRLIRNPPSEIEVVANTRPPVVEPLKATNGSVRSYGIQWPGT